MFPKYGKIHLGALLWYKESIFLRWLLQTVSTNMDSLSTSFDNLYFPAITVCNINFMQRSVLEKYNLQSNETLIDIFDRMMNKGSDKPFTTDELEVKIKITTFIECPLSIQPFVCRY